MPGLLHQDTPRLSPLHSQRAKLAWHMLYPCKMPKAQNKSKPHGCLTALHTTVSAANISWPSKLPGDTHSLSPHTRSVALLEVLSIHCPHPVPFPPLLSIVMQSGKKNLSLNPILFPWCGPYTPCSWPTLPDPTPSHKAVHLLTPSTWRQGQGRVTGGWISP